MDVSYTSTEGFRIIAKETCSRDRGLRLFLPPERAEPPQRHDQDDDAHEDASEQREDVGSFPNDVRRWRWPRLHVHEDRRLVVRDLRLRRRPVHDDREDVPPDGPV